MTNYFDEGSKAATRQRWGGDHFKHVRIIVFLEMLTIELETGGSGIVQSSMAKSRSLYGSGIEIVITITLWDQDRNRTAESQSRYKIKIAMALWERGT